LRIPDSWLNTNASQDITAAKQKSSDPGNSINPQELSLKNPLIDNTNVSQSNKKEVIANILKNMGLDISLINEIIISRTELLLENNISPDIKVVLNEWESINGIFSNINELKTLIILVMNDKHTDIVLKNALSEFIKTLNNLMYTDIDTIQENPILLKEILLKTGIFFEQKLYKWFVSSGDAKLLSSLMKDDLKGMIFLLNDLLKKDNSLSRSIKNALEKEILTLSDNIKNYQLLNFVNEKTESGGFLFEIPFWNEKKGKNPKFYREKSQEKKTEKSDLKMISFQIETEKMGLIKVFLGKKERDVSMKFIFEDRNIEDFFRKAAVELENKLEKRGYFCKLSSFTSQKKMGTTPDKNKYKKIDTVG